MKKFDTLVGVLAKLLEVVHWIGCAGAAVLFVVSFTAQPMLSGWLSAAGTFQCYGIEIAPILNGSVHFGVVRISLIAFLLVFTLMAMVFRNIYLISKTAKGRTWFSEGDTPFQQNIVRMVREIGIYLIAVPVLGMLLSVITRCIFGTDIVVGLSNAIVGFVVLYLAQIFARGTQLQKDVDGLL